MTELLSISSASCCASASTASVTSPSTVSSKRLPMRTALNSVLPSSGERPGDGLAGRVEQLGLGHDLDDDGGHGRLPGFRGAGIRPSLRRREQRCRRGRRRDAAMSAAFASSGPSAQARAASGVLPNATCRAISRCCRMRVVDRGRTRSRRAGGATRSQPSRRAAGSCLRRRRSGCRGLDRGCAPGTGSSIARSKRGASHGSPRESATHRREHAVDERGAGRRCRARPSGRGGRARRAAPAAGGSRPSEAPRHPEPSAVGGGRGQGRLAGAGRARDADEHARRPPARVVPAACAANSAAAFTVGAVTRAYAIADSPRSQASSTAQSAQSR